MEDEAIFDEMDESLNEFDDRDSFGEIGNFFVDVDEHDSYEITPNTIREVTNLPNEGQIQDGKSCTEDVNYNEKNNETAKSISFKGSHKCSKCDCQGFVGYGNYCSNPYCGHHWDSHNFFS